MVADLAASRDGGHPVLVPREREQLWVSEEDDHEGPLGREGGVPQGDVPQVGTGGSVVYSVIRRIQDLGAALHLELGELESASVVSIAVDGHREGDHLLHHILTLPARPCSPLCDDVSPPVHERDARERLAARLIMVRIHHDDVHAVASYHELRAHRHCGGEVMQSTATHAPRLDVQRASVAHPASGARVARSDAEADAGTAERDERGVRIRPEGRARPYLRGREQGVEAPP